MQIELQRNSIEEMKEGMDRVSIERGRGGER